ncbi:hypothetical protein ACRQ4C_00175 [Curtobacterium sp. SP.BCp]|uniref:hypothetical protein n=1 Tax=Curtobacterium TaxID=2034 RepID=UPI003BEF83DC
MTDEQEPNPIADARAQIRWMMKQQRKQPKVFTEVKDRDLVTLMDRSAGSLEFNSMLVASQLIAEVSRRQLWAAVVERRTAMLALGHPDQDRATLRDRAQLELDRFRNEHFPVDPDIFGDDEVKAEAAWNGYVQF